MNISADKYNRMPADLRALFYKAPNPGSDEVLAGFPAQAGASAPVNGTEHSATGQNGIYGHFERVAGPFHADAGSAARFFKCCPPDALCALCDLPTSDAHGIMNETREVIPCQSDASSAGKSSSQSITIPANVSVAIPVPQNGRHNKGGKPGQSVLNAPSAEGYSATLPAMEGYTAQMNADAERVARIALNARLAGNLCERCATGIAQSIVAMQRDQGPASILGQVFISERKRQILTRCLVSFVALLGNTDIIPTTESLSLLFGSVYHAIASCTESQGEVASGTCQTRLRYVSKASKADRDEGLEGFESVWRANGNKWTDQDYRVSRGERPPSAESGPRRNPHPTVKPTALMRYLCRLITPPGGVVLDPFMGSGSTGKGAVLEGFSFVGIEAEPEYFAIAQARIADAQAQPRLEGIAV